MIFTSLGFDGTPDVMLGTTELFDDDGDSIGFGVDDSCGTNGGRLRDPNSSTVFNSVTNPLGSQNVDGDEYCGGNVTFDAAGNIIPWINSGADTTRYNYAPVNYLQLPQERYTLAAFGRYDITDTVELKLRSIFTSNVVPQELAPTPFFSTVTVNIDSNPFLSASQRAAFRTTSNSGIAAARRSIVDAPLNAADLNSDLNDDGTLNTENDVSPAALAATIAGLNATIATLDTDGDGVGDALPVFIGRRMLEIGPRNADQELQSMQISADLGGEFGFGWDWDVHSHLSRTSGSFVQTGNVSISAMQNAVSSGTCNIFGEGAFSDDCVDLVSRTGIIQSVSEQRNIVATTGGAIEAFKSPMADSPLQTVLGVEYKEDSFDFRPDSVLGPDVAGFNQSLPVSGTTDSYEAFGEVFFPLIEGQQFFDELSVNGAYRYTDHSNAGGFSSYAAGAEWAPNSDIRFRGQYQRAVRAPNVVELFSPQTNGFPRATDPCANPTSTTQASICNAAGSHGIGSGTFGDENLQANSQTEGLFGGNPNLSTEVSDTFTIGFVAQPSFLEGLTLTVDWYDIDVDNAISTIPIQDVLDGCYDGVTPAFCSLINRQATGAIDFVELNNQNVAFLGASGIDFQVDYSFDAAQVGMGNFGGEFDFQLIGGYALSSEFQSLPTSDIDDCVGFHGAQAGICTEPRPELKTTTRLTYSNGPVSMTTRWRYLGNTKNDEFNVNAGGASNFDPKFVTQTGAQHYFDMTGTWDVSDTVQISGGILNLTDNQPPELGDCCSQQANTYPATYRTLGRQFYMGGKLRF